MPRILIYEECLAAGSAGPLGDEARVFLSEGLAMTLAVAEDFAKLPEWQVRVLLANECISLTPAEVPWQWVEVRDDLESTLAREAAAADATLVIAPECGGLLEQRAQAVIDAGGKLLGPSPEFIALASDKTAIIDHLMSQGVQTTRGYRGTLTELISQIDLFPFIVKPNDGAGATDVHLFYFLEELADWIAHREAAGTTADEHQVWRAEKYVPGTKVSCSVMCGANGNLTLRPATQDVRFSPLPYDQASYHGGALRLTPEEEKRARSLAQKAIAALPPTRGYLGIDMILVPPFLLGVQDTVIEVNPRLTTSYLGLRAATDDSLAEAMWRIAEGETVNIAWQPNHVEFTKQGQVFLRERS